MFIRSSDGKLFNADLMPAIFITSLPDGDFAIQGNGATIEKYYTMTEAITALNAIYEAMKNHEAAFTMPE